MKIFGFEIKRRFDDDKHQQEPTIAVTQSKYGKNTSYVETDQWTAGGGGLVSMSIDMGSNLKNDNDFIMNYRNVSLQPEAADAISEIVNEVVVVDNKSPIISLDMDDVDLTDDVKTKINSEFDKILQLMDWRNECYNLFERWYIDGRLFFQKIINKNNVQDGIIQLVELDPLKIKEQRVIFTDPETKKTTVNEFFVYSETFAMSSQNQPNPPKSLSNTIDQSSGTGESVIQLPVDAVAFCHSGLVDRNSNQRISYLHKAVKPIQTLRNMEDMMVIYRLARAPERKVFYVGTGKLPKGAREQFVQNLKNMFKNKITYNAHTGSITDDRRFMTVAEDYWIPRGEDGKNTEVQVLQGAQNLSEIDDVLFFKKAVYQTLHVPINRLIAQDKSFNMGGVTGGAEITRDELKFFKFIMKLRNQFGMVFFDLLKTQLLLRGIVDMEDWDIIKEKLFIKWNTNNYFSETKEAEILSRRLELLGKITEHNGTWYDEEYIRKYVLHQDELEIKEIKERITIQNSKKKREAEENKDDAIEVGDTDFGSIGTGTDYGSDNSGLDLSGLNEPSQPQTPLAPGTFQSINQPSSAINPPTL